jgi:hypothetical protein
MRNYLRAIGLLSAPAVVTVAAAKLESLLLAMLGVGGSIAAGIYCARLVLWDYEVTGIKAMLVQFGVAFALGVLSLSISYLGCSLILGNS